MYKLVCIDSLNEGDVVAHCFVLSPQEAEADGSESEASPIYKVTLCLNKRKKKSKRNKIKRNPKIR